MWKILASPSDSKLLTIPTTFWCSSCHSSANLRVLTGPLASTYFRTFSDCSVVMLLFRRRTNIGTRAYFSDVSSPFPDHYNRCSTNKQPNYPNIPASRILSPFHTLKTTVSTIYLQYQCWMILSVSPIWHYRRIQNSITNNRTMGSITSTTLCRKCTYIAITTNCREKRLILCINFHSQITRPKLWKKQQLMY